VKPLLLVAAMFLVPVLGGIVLGLVQLAAYRLLRRPQVPPFPILLARGMLAVVVGAVVLALATRGLGG